MADLRITPSTKLIKARYVLAVLLTIAIGYGRYTWPHDAWLFAFAVPLILLLLALTAYPFGVMDRIS